MTPHRALYDITLRSANNSSGIADIHGQMLYDLQETCDGWATTHRFILVYDYIDNPTSQVVSEFTTLESKDGQKFEFRARRIKDGQPEDEVAGKAAKSADPSKDFFARFSFPEKNNMKLSSDTVFPTTHTMNVINNARAGKKFITGTVFDGSDTDGAYQVSGLILKPISEPERKRKWPSEVDTALVRGAGWRTQVAIFPLVNTDEASSEYEMDINLLENGVVTDMNIRYADFAITQKLKALSANEKPSCKDSLATPAKSSVPEKTKPKAPVQSILKQEKKS